MSLEGGDLGRVDVRLQVVLAVKVAIGTVTGSLSSKSLLLLFLISRLPSGNHFKMFALFLCP